MAEETTKETQDRLYKEIGEETIPEEGKEKFKELEKKFQSAAENICQVAILAAISGNMESTPLKQFIKIATMLEFLHEKGGTTEQKAAMMRNLVFGSKTKAADV